MGNLLWAMREWDREGVFAGVRDLLYRVMDFAPEPLRAVLHEGWHCKALSDISQWQYQAEQAVIAFAEAQFERGEKREGLDEDRVACPLCGYTGSGAFYVHGLKLPRGLEMHLEGTGGTRRCFLFECAHDHALLHVWEAEREELIRRNEQRVAERKERLRLARENRKKKPADNEGKVGEG